MDKDAANIPKGGVSIDELPKMLPVLAVFVVVHVIEPDEGNGSNRVSDGQHGLKLCVGAEGRELTACGITSAHRRGIVDLLVPGDVNGAFAVYGAEAGGIVFADIRSEAVTHRIIDGSRI